MIRGEANPGESDANVSGGLREAFFDSTKVRFEILGIGETQIGRADGEVGENLIVLINQEHGGAGGASFEAEGDFVWGR